MTKWAFKCSPSPCAVSGTELGLLCYKHAEDTTPPADAKEEALHDCMEAGQL